MMASVERLGFFVESECKARNSDENKTVIELRREEYLEEKPWINYYYRPLNFGVVNYIVFIYAYFNPFSTWR